MKKARNIFFALSAVCLLWACREEVKNVITTPASPESLPTMITRNVSTLVSDSGITRYRITTDTWLIFEEAEEPYWLFPDGLRLEQFDSVFNTAASIRCDSAKFFKDDQLWRLDGNVRITTIKKELILTNQLFWAQKKQQVYSDSFVHIEQAERVLEGFGFVSNDRMTTYNLKNPSGIFPIDEEQMSPRRAARDSSAIDSIPQ